MDIVDEHSENKLNTPKRTLHFYELRAKHCHIQDKYASQKIKIKHLYR